MTQTAINYAKALFELGIPEPDMHEARSIIEDNAELYDVLCNPSVNKDAKHRIIEKIFPSTVRNFLKLLCDNQNAHQVIDIIDCYEKLVTDADGSMSAELIYCDAPSDSQLNGIKEKLAKKYGKSSLDLTLTEDKSLIGGFKIIAGDEEIDYSIKGRIEQLSQKLIRR